MCSVRAVVDKVGRLIQRYQGGESLYMFTTEELCYFPLPFLIRNTHSHELNAVWDRLPEGYTDSHELKLCLPCMCPEIIDPTVDVYEGPRIRRACYKCRHIYGDLSLV